jgi:hypothetical protein
MPQSQPATLPFAARIPGARAPIAPLNCVHKELVHRGLARVGIVALVDEATGYQEIRDRLALQAILDKYVTDE